MLILERYCGDKEKRYTLIGTSMTWAAGSTGQEGFCEIDVNSLILN